MPAEDGVGATGGAGPVELVEVADPGLLGGDRRESGRPEAYGVAARAAKPAAAQGEGIEVVPEDIVLMAQVHARFRTT